MMAPSKKSRSVKRRLSSLNAISPEQDVETTSRSKKRKRKLSSKLGSQWSNDELECFYEAYRKHGQDWRKVAASVHNRSTDMVEALYIMNRAYLSLPEGTASVAGLKAMMTDHYSVLDGTDSEPDSNYASEISQKFQKSKQGKLQLCSTKEDRSYSQSVASRDVYLSLLRNRHSDGSQARAVGKRTPRYAVSYINKKDHKENSFLPKKKCLKSEDANENDGVHVAALALTEGSMKGGSPKVSQTTRRRMDHTKFSHVQRFDRTEPENGRDELVNFGLESEENAKYTISLGDMEGVATVVHQKKKFQEKKENFEDVRKCHFGDGTEACSGTERHKASALKGNIDVEVSDVKVERVSPQGQRKRSKKLFFGDGGSALDQLADLSLMFPESESSGQLMEDRARHELDDNEAASTSGRDKIKFPGAKEKVIPAVSGFQGSNSRRSKLGRDWAISLSSASEAKQHCSNKIARGKRKSQMSDAEAHHLSRLREAEVFGEEDKTESKGRYAMPALSKQRKSIRMLEGSSDQKRSRSDADTSNVHVPSISEVGTRTRQKRMMNQKRLISKDMKSSEKFLKNKCRKTSTVTYDSALHLREQLSRCLSSYTVRRWCIFEWFYSAIEYPWFARGEFVEYLKHVGLGHIPRLTHVEWSVIKSSLGKPRRFSKHFLDEEREKLQQYRESVRKHYSELRNGIKEGLPTDLARPLSVGQRVLALHPKTREVYDGSILTVDHDNCRVQFDRLEIGVEFVKDIDCMPLNPLDNMPEALRRQHTDVNRFTVISKDQNVNGHMNFGGSMTFASSGHQENATNPRIKQTKDALMMELRNVNNDVLVNQNEDNSLKDTELFTKQYTTVSNALDNLRQFNTHPGNSLPPWIKHSIVTNLLNGSSSDSSFLCQEPGSNVVEIVKGSRTKAHAMVDTAIQAMESMKDGEDAFAMVGAALDSLETRKFASDARPSIIRPAPMGHMSAPVLQDDSQKGEAQIPSELITSCVANLLMIQTCTQIQYPPADVAQILDFAVKSLHPSCPRNIPIYREIQMSMGRLKNQILALIPTSI